MTTPAGNDNIIIDITGDLNIDTTKAQRSIQDMMDKVNRGAGAMVAGAASAFGVGGAKAGAEGDVKGADERSKVRTAALSKLAQQFPGGGLMTQMASAFKGGGMMAGVATGITAAVGILTNIMKSSQVFQTLSGTVFKVLGFMADMFLMPFVPMMMKFVTWMLQNMPQVVAAGEATAKWVERIFNFFTGKWGSGLTESGKEQGGIGGFGKRLAGAAFSKEGLMIAGGATMMATGVGAPLGAGLVAGGVYGMGKKTIAGEYQMGGLVPGSPGQGVPTMLHGGEMVIPQDIAAGAKGMSGRVAAWIERFQQKEMGPGGVMDRWYDQMFGHSIMPEIWNNIRGLMGNIESEARVAGQNVASDTSTMEDDNKSFWDKFKFWEYFDKPFEAIKGFFSGLGEKIKEFFTFELPEMPKFPDLGGALSSLTSTLSGVGQTIRVFFAGLPSKIPAINLPDLTEDFSQIKTTMNAIKDKVTDFLSGLYNRISGKEKEMAIIDDTGEGAWEEPKGESLKDRLLRYKNDVWSWFTNKDHPGGLLWGAIKLYNDSGLKYAVDWTVDAFWWIWYKLVEGKDVVKKFFRDTLPTWAGNAVTAVSDAASAVFNRSAEIVGDIKRYLGKAYDNAVFWVGNFFTNDIPDWIYDRIEDVKKIFDDLPGLNLDEINKGLGRIHSAIQGKMKEWGFRIGDQNIDVKQFGSLTSGYNPALYPGAVKNIIPKIIGGLLIKPCPDGSIPPCKDLCPDGSYPPCVPKPCVGPGCPGYVYPGEDVEEDRVSGGEDPPPGGGGGGAVSTPDEVAATQAQVSADSGFEGGNFPDYNPDPTPSEYESQYDYWENEGGGWQYGNVGGGGSRRASRRASRMVRINSGPRYNNRSTRILNVNIHSSLSVADIVNDIERLESMNEASFFNGVM